LNRIPEWGLSDKPEGRKPMRTKIIPALIIFSVSACAAWAGGNDPQHKCVDECDFAMAACRRACPDDISEGPFCLDQCFRTYRTCVDVCIDRENRQMRQINAPQADYSGWEEPQARQAAPQGKTPIRGDH